MPDVKSPTLKQALKHLFAVIKRLAGRPFVRSRMQKRVRTGLMVFHLNLTLYRVFGVASHSEQEITI